MLEELFQLTDLTLTEGIYLGVVVMIAGVVRGFTGFALSALIMASAAMIIPPIELIPICWMMELTASLLMIKDGIKDANKKVSFGLFIGAVFGLPLALYLTSIMDEDISKLAALSLIISLALLQLMNIRFAFLATTPGLYASGMLAGMATGIAAVGGLVVALYVLAQELPARIMRSSLVLYLFLGSFTGFFFLILFEMLNAQSLIRGAILIIPCLMGVFLGQHLFTPRFEAYYKPFCLCLLIGLACFGILKLLLGV